MKFNLIDKVEELTSQRIVAVKQVTLAEEYLADHFPTFPVLPGVLMLEALTQAAGWMMHVKHGFGRSMAVLKEARNVKYGQFVAPGDAFRIEVEWIASTDDAGRFKASGSVHGKTGVSARLELAYFSLGQKQPALAELDGRMIEYNRSRWALIEPKPGTPGGVAV